MAHALSFQRPTAAVPCIRPKSQGTEPLQFKCRRSSDGPSISRAAVRCQASEESSASEHSQGMDVPRRSLLIGLPAVATGLACAASLPVLPALATPSFTAPPPGFRLYADRFDGYSFYIPETWSQIRGSGQDCFFRSPNALDENISVQVSSPSSSRFFDISDLGTPEEAGQQLLKQFLTEFMSTRLGVKREPTLLRTDVRSSVDGDFYYEIELNVKSYASNNSMAVMPEERAQELEWDRHYLTILGVANRRLYQLRAQVPEKLLDAQLPQLRQILNSFQAFEVLSV